ncbi:MAG: methyltransferase domain-containing protein [Planctomycetota bacterium]|nr:MAG: methyltransferase domain-containing protein [Planctomycetota bacterium]
MTDWRRRYREGHTPWDLGRAHPELVRRLAAGELRPPRPGARALVPGCGRGWDAAALAEAGWQVTAADVVEELREAVEALLGSGGGFLARDVLEPTFPEQPFDLLFDHTFFCALQPRRRPDFGRLARRAVAPGGLLVSLVFPLDRPAAEGGPPFGMCPADLRAALGPEFVLETDEPVPGRFGGRAWDSRWCRFRRVVRSSPEKRPEP